MRRQIPPGDSLPPMGWTMAPVFTPINCSWCGEPVVDIRGLIMCPECDPIAEWPSNERD